MEMIFLSKQNGETRKVSIRTDHFEIQRKIGVYLSHLQNHLNLRTLASSGIGFKTVGTLCWLLFAFFLDLPVFVDVGGGVDFLVCAGGLVDFGLPIGRSSAPTELLRTDATLISPLGRMLPKHSPLLLKNNFNLSQSFFLACLDIRCSSNVFSSFVFLKMSRK